MPVIQQNGNTPPIRQYSLTKLFFLYLMLIVGISFIALGAFYVIKRISVYNKDVRQLKISFPHQQRKEMKIRVLEAKQFIDWVSSYPNESLNNQLASMTKRYASFLETANLPKGKNLIMLPGRFRDSLDEVNRNTVIKILVFNSALDPVYIPDLSDSVKLSLRYKQLINRMISPAVIKKASLRPNSATHYSNNEGNEYASLLPANNIDFWVMAVFAGDKEKALQEIVLDSLSRVRFEDNEYFIINTMGGDALLTRTYWDKTPVNILDGDDEKWKQIFRQQIRLAKTSGGGYITYNWNRTPGTSKSEKISYFTGISNWNWIIGTGKHTEALLPLLEQKRKDLVNEIKIDFITRLIFVFFIFLLIFIIGKILQKNLNSNILLFNAFFTNAVSSSQPIDEESVHFSEFGTLARSANLMIEERERIKSLLNEQQSRLRYILDSIPDLIFFKDINSRFQGCNKAFEKFVNKKESEIIGLTEYDLFSQAQAEVYLASDKHLLLTGESVRTKEWTQASESRSSLLFDTLKTTYLDNEGNVLGIIAISRDITEMEETRQRLLLAKDKAEESDRLKTAFLANMSHEIRTPMNAIIGFSDLLAEDDLTKEEKADFVEKIKLSGENLMNLINDIIDIAKIEAGQLKIIESPCNIDEMLYGLHGTFSGIKNQQKKQAIELLYNVHKSDYETVTVTDPMRLQQVLTNLLGNALKFTEQGVIEFGYDIENGFLKFYVKDTGIGIPESKQEVLFQRFSQVDASTTRKFGGTGLGLAISRNIVELLGGSIWFESEPGVGSTFYFTLPYKPTDNQNNGNINPSNGYDWSQYTIMVAEDVDENYMLLEGAFRRTGVKLIHARDGLAAVNEAKSNEAIDLVLMDIQLPVMTGYEAIHNILLVRPGLPIISYTAYALPNEREKSLEAGCVDYITKPIKPEKLLPVINKYLKPRDRVNG